jgi:hypothetical protein
VFDVFLGFDQEIATSDDILIVVAKGVADFLGDGFDCAAFGIRFLTHRMYPRLEAAANTAIAFGFSLPLMTSGIERGARQAHIRPRS